MTSESNHPGFCKRCGCANANHMIQRCIGQDKRRTGRSTEFVRCANKWSRCTTGGHSSYFEEEEDPQYLDCFRCSNHPGGPPVGFWGTQPTDKASRITVLTADILGLPWPEPDPALIAAGSSRTSESPDPLSSAAESTCSGRTWTTTRRHGRAMSEESLDPLHSDSVWNQIPSAATDPLTALAGDLSRFELQEYDERCYVEATAIDERVYFIDAGGNSVVSYYTDWTASSIENQREQVPCYLYVGQTTGPQYYTWAFGDGGNNPGNNGKGKSKDKDKDNGSAMKGKTGGSSKGHRQKKMR